MKYEIIDNFLDEKHFTELEKDIVNPFYEMPWFMNDGVSGDFTKENKNSKIFYMTHTFYNDNMPTSNRLNKLNPLLKKLNVLCLIRIKANLFPNTEKLHEHPMHIDYNFYNTGAVLSLNTCDGYTKLEDGTKINSVANRLLLFDASTPHCSTTTTNVPARININMNFIREQYNE